MKIERNGDIYNMKLSAYEIGMINELLMDGITYNINENYESKKSIKNETDIKRLKDKFESCLLINEKLDAGEIISQTIKDSLPQRI